MKPEYFTVKDSYPVQIQYDKATNSIVVNSNILTMTRQLYICYTQVSLP
jgi:hypothetical protein